MAAEIYIFTKALEKRAINIQYVTHTIEYPCHCSATNKGFCESCNSYAQTWDEHDAIIEGLPTMGTLGNELVWHQAAHWGSSRPKLMAFIEKHQLTDDEWYEA